MTELFLAVYACQNKVYISPSVVFCSQQIANGLWPMTWSNLLGVVVVIGAMLYATDFYKLP